jgi:hypothetical protein
MSSTQDDFEKIVKRLTEIRRRKNSDYGDGFLRTYEQYGSKSVFFDLLRKWQRIENILFKEKEIKVSEETLQDTLGDLSVMCINAMIYFDRIKKRSEDDATKI